MDAVIIGHDSCVTYMNSHFENAKVRISQYKLFRDKLISNLDNMDKNSAGAKELQKKIFYFSSLISGFEDGFKLTTPNITFSEKLNLDLGDLSLELMYYGYSHSKTDIIIHCPEEQILCTGDIFYKESDPYFDTERISYIPIRKKVLEYIFSQKEHINYIIPGHAELINISELEDDYKKMSKKWEEIKGKESVYPLFTKEYFINDVESAIKKLEECKSENDQYYILHGEFDSFAYRLMLSNKLEEAKLLFEILAEFFPESYIAFDSLGEVYLRLNEKDLAIKYFEKSLMLNPENANAQHRISELRKES
jgi:tetratricopeptide (TPR) repeat protein